MDKDGVVHFSDQPGSANAVLITVIEPNSYENEAGRRRRGRKPGSGDGADDGRRTSRHTASFSIRSPTADQVFFGADAVVTAIAELDGTLNPDHSLVFFLNGKRRDCRGPQPEFTKPGARILLPACEHPRRDGKPVISSPQITFHVRQPSINSPQSPQAPPKPTPGLRRGRNPRRVATNPATRRRGAGAAPWRMTRKRAPGASIPPRSLDLLATAILVVDERSEVAWLNQAAAALTRDQSRAAAAGRSRRCSRTPARSSRCSRAAAAAHEPIALRGVPLAPAARADARYQVDVT